MLRHKTINQLLLVFEKTRANIEAGQSVRIAYQSAVHFVAKKYDVAYQTIGDGCRRRLELDDVKELYSLIQKWVSGNPREIMDLLINIAPPDRHLEIRKFFQDGRREQAAIVEDEKPKAPETFVFELDRVDALMLRMLCEMEDEPIEKFIKKTIQKQIRTQMKPYMKDLFEATS